MKLSDWRLDHVWLLFRQQREMNGVRRQLAEEVSQAVVDLCPGEVYDRRCHERVKTHIDRVIWPKYYGRFRGDFDAEFPKVIEAGAVRAFLLVWGRAQQKVEAVLSKRDPELLEALKELAREQDNA